MIVKLIITCITMAIVIPLIGMLYTKFIDQEKNCWSTNYMAGFIFILAVGQLVILPCIFLEVSFQTCFMLILGGWILLCLCSLCLNRKRIVEFISENGRRTRKLPLMLIISIVIMAIQMYAYVTYTHIDEDDAFYVATATTTIESDGVFQVDPYTGSNYRTFPMRYVLSPFPVFTAFLSRLFEVHATIMAHSILPVLLVLFCFSIYYSVGKRLFKEDGEKAATFVIICQVIQIFSGFNVYQQGMFFLVRIWQGKGLLTAALLPACFYLGLKMLEQTMKLADWLLLLALMLACCLVSSMGIILGAVAIGCIGLTNLIMCRKIMPVIWAGLCCLPNLLLGVIYMIRT